MASLTSWVVSHNLIFALGWKGHPVTFIIIIPQMGYTILIKGVPIDVHFVDILLTDTNINLIKFLSFEFRFLIFYFRQVECYYKNGTLWTKILVVCYVWDWFTPSKQWCIPENVTWKWRSEALSDQLFCFQDSAEPKNFFSLHAS